MANANNWAKKHTFAIYCLAFFLMVLPAIGLYFSAKAQAGAWMIGLLALFVFANILVLFPR